MYLEVISPSMFQTESPIVIQMRALSAAKRKFKSEYLLVMQHRPHVACRSRRGRDRSTETVFCSLDVMVRLDSIGIDLTMRELYDGVR